MSRWRLIVHGVAFATFRVIALALVAGAGVACHSATAPSDGGSIGGTPPSTLDPRFTPVLTVSSLPIASAASGWMNFTGQPVTISWNAIPSATRYTVEIGSAPGLHDVESVTTANLAITRTFGAAATVYPRVVARIGTASHPSDDRLPLVIVAFQDLVEALFLGTGPLAQSPQTGCLTSGAMTGWPPSSNVVVTLAASLNATQRQRAAVAVAQANDAVAGAFGVTMRDSGEQHPAAGPFEIVAQQSDVTFPFPCSNEALGCAVPLQFAAPGQLLRAQIVMNGSSLRIGHEVGHALYGFCHLTPAAGFFSVMGNFDDDGRGLAEADVAAVRAVYRAGLRGGATRGAFVSAGLVKP